MSVIRLLKEVFLRNLIGSPLKGIDNATLEELIKKGLVEVKNGNITLSNKGRSMFKVVLAGGVFDIIHPGHIYTLKKAKELGDVLVVVVARDKTVLKMRGKMAVNDERLRLELVSNLKPVDLAILGSERDIFEIIEKVKPDIIALGYDQAHDERELVEEGRKRGLNFKVVRLDTPYPHLKSTKLKSNPDAMNSF